MQIGRSKKVAMKGKCNVGNLSWNVRDYLGSEALDTRFFKNEGKEKKIIGSSAGNLKTTYQGKQDKQCRKVSGLLTLSGS